MPPFLPIIFVICCIVKGLNNLLVLAANIQKIPLKAKRMGKKVALSGFFNILAAKKVLQEYNFNSKVEPFKMIFRVIGLKGYKKFG